MTHPVVALNQILYRWRKGAPVCLDIDSFNLMPGERVFLHGPSGCGKSTLLSLIAGVVMPERGSVQMMGADLVGQRSSVRDRHRAEHIGFIFQMFNLIPYLSAMDNILLPCRFSRRRREKIAGAGLTPEDEARRLATRLHLAAELLRCPATELSVGQQQRVAAARALIGRPELIIADEPTSALDSDAQKGFLDLLLSECALTGASVLFVSHDARLASKFDRVVTLNDINRVATQRGFA